MMALDFFDHVVASTISRLALGMRYGRYIRGAIKWCGLLAAVPLASKTVMPSTP